MGRTVGNRPPRRRNEPGGRVARPVPVKFAKWVALSASVAPAGRAYPKGTGLVPVPRYSRMIRPALGFAGRVSRGEATRTHGLGIHRPRRGQAVEGAAGPPAAP